MRNLQKILALVLALVMSLSLMATAGARDFTDGDQIDETFAESVDVLTGLEVFQGYPTGDFQPKGDITRAEVAAIIYRIATGDVTDSQVGIYADYNKFSDVPSDNWAAGYINYCANAEYIKGRGDGKFYPQDKVTGYEALAMILRVVGYDKNGEFTGADWQVQTAATANQRKVTKNVNAGTLGNPASRETVAELLCQAILIEKVNYTLAFGYQISTDPEDTIAYETFKMEKLEGVVTGNEIADLKTDKGTALGANQTRLVIDGREEVMNIPTGLDDIGECVRVYIRPENGTTRSNLVTSKVYSDGLNKVFTTSERVGSVGNTTASSEGITSIEGAEHFINFDQAHKWEARSVIRYTIDVRMSEYDAKVMYWQNGTSSNSRLTGMANTVYAAQNDSGVNNNEYIGRKDINEENWDKLIRTASGATYTYTKTIDAFTNLTDQDYANIRAIFTNANYTNANGIVKGEVYVGTSSITHTDDVSDDIRWEDFIATYLKAEENKEQVESNGQGFLLKIIDNDNDGIAEYVLQTRYTVAKVAANGTGLDIANLKLTDSDMCNEVSASDKITVVSGTNLEASEDTVAAGDVVIYAMIDGTVRAQKAESETSRVTTINRAATPVTATIESGEKKQSAVHEHSEALASGLTNMVIGTNYTVYFDLYGNIAAFTEGDVGGFVLVTDGWFNQTAAAREYAIQAYVDGALQTVNITNNGSLFINDGDVNNRWGALKTTFGTVTNVNEGNINYGGKHIHTIVATLEGNNLVPVDKSYRYSQTVRMLDIPSNTVPGINGADAVAYETTYGVDATAYQTPDKGPNNDATSKVYGRSDTVYYYVYKDGTKNTVTGQDNVVVRTYTGYNNIPGINSIYIEDVYAVGIRTNRNIGNTTPNYVYTADAVVVELNDKYQYQNTTSEQVFIPGATIVNNSVSRVAGQGWETVTMIRGNGEVQDVTVDLTVSKDYQTVNGYDPVDGRSRIAAGLYYMDPIDTNSSIYAIRKMSNADIRANNYLTGYVDSSTILANNWVQVEVMMQSQVQNPAGEWKGVPAPSNLNVNGQPVGKRVDTENLYTLDGYTLTKAPAATVFEQWTGIHVNNNNAHPLNELYNVKTNSFPLSLPNRNEILVRYSGDSVVWAVSFAELSGSDMNRAQTVWYNNLVDHDDNVTSGVKFFGNADTDGDKNITINYADVVKGAPVINMAEIGVVNGVTVRDYTLTKWTDTLGYGENIPQNKEDGETADKYKTTGVKYKLVVNFVSGGFETYYLELKAAGSEAGLGVKAGVTESSYLDTNVTPKALKLPDNLNLLAFIQQFKVTPATATVTWKFEGTNIDVTVESVVDPVTGEITNGVMTGGENLGNLGIQTNNIDKASATVKNERGDVVETLLFNRIPSGGSAQTARFSISNFTRFQFNGVTYRHDMGAAQIESGGNTGYYFTFPVGTKIALIPSDPSEIGYFICGGQTIATMTAVGEPVEVTITTAMNDGRISFRSTKPTTVDPTDPEIIPGVKNTVSETMQVNKTSATASYPVIDIDKDTEIVVEAGKVLTINANGAASGARSGGATKGNVGIRVQEGATLTLSGEGTIKFINLSTGGRGFSVIGNLVVTGDLTLESDSWAIAVYDGSEAPSSVSLTGTKIKAGIGGVTAYGKNKMQNTINLNGVTIDSNYCGVYLAGMSTTMIENSNITVKEDAAVEVRAGSATIRNSHLKSTDQTASVTKNDSGTTTRGAALAVVPHKAGTAGDRTTTVYMEGGSLSATWPVLVAARDNANGTVSVTVANDTVLQSSTGTPLTTASCKNHYPAGKGTVSVCGTQIPYTALSNDTPTTTGTDGSGESSGENGGSGESGSGTTPSTPTTR